jgi:thiamine biosynthesis protein ThiS
MNLTVNGDPVEVPDGCTVAGLLAHMRIDAARVAVERNQDVVPRRTYSEARLAEGDRIEIVTFVGGGC